MKIKVCGMTDPGNMTAVIQLGIDAIGWIFYPDSERSVMSGITSLAKVPRGKVRVVGVFVNEPADVVLEIAHRWNLDAIQLHGDESNDVCRSLAAEIPVIKTIHVGSAEDMDRCGAYPDAHALLLETKSARWGGSGRSFDWSLIRHYHGTQPFYLSGGIGPDHLEAIAAIDHPQFMGIDINSRFETAPGLKNTALLKPFVEALKSAAHAS
ncbi:MAG: phosphoribosylanthranilate isomerase [Saprospiraceae bacterium]|nr:phosphoribosylanthranilate isomerase [Saprospiraceae bacterium]